MKISQILQQDGYRLSFEVFPPKKSTGLENVRKATEEIAKLEPSFVSVTYGAGGGTSDFTLDIAKNIKEQTGVPVLAHITCVSSSREKVASYIDALKASGIENVMALRGDLTPEMEFYSFLYRVRDIGIDVPVIPGIMPITNANQVEKALKLSGCHMPIRFTSLVDRFGSNAAAMQQAGIIYATEQIIDLYANGIRNVHVYTMNKPEVASGILNNVSAILNA